MGYSRTSIFQYHIHSIPSYDAPIPIVQSEVWFLFSHIDSNLVAIIEDKWHRLFVVLTFFCFTCVCFIFSFIRQERFRTITQSYYRSANGVIIGDSIVWSNNYRQSLWNYTKFYHIAFPVYDITKRSTFLSIQRWIEEVRRYTTSDVILILIGNKCDLEDEREVSERL